MNRYKYAILDGKLSTIRFSNDYSNRPCSELVFVDYKLSKNYKCIEGLVFDYLFSIDGDTPLFLVDEKEIINRHFLFWSWKTYRRGWILLKDRKPMKIENPKGFIVIEGDLS